MSRFEKRSDPLPLAVLVAVLVGFIAFTARADTWRGTAPFCAGECLAGETKISTSDYGDGGYCITGHKVLCKNNHPMCQSLQTKTA